MILTRFMRIRPSHLIGGIFVMTVLLISEYAMTWSGGKTGQTEKPGSGNGCTCHCATSNTSTTVSVSTGSSTFEGGNTYTFTVSISSSDGNHSKAGFNAAVSRGTLNVGSDNGVQKIGDEVTHNGSPKNLPASFSFTYTAPNTAGGDTIYVTANAVNNDGTNGGGNCTDKWNHAAKFVMNVTVPNRSLLLTKSTVAFGNVRLGQNRSDTLRIISNGDAALTVSSSAMKTGAPFSASPTGTNRSLSVGTQETNTITFNPTTRGAYVDTFVVNSNASTAADQRKTVVVTGTAIQAVFTGANSFPMGNVRIGQTKDTTYTYQNTGDDTLFITGASLASTTFFSIQGSPAATIPPNGTGSVTVRYAPTARATNTTNLTFTASNSIATPTVAVSGTGTSPQLSTLGLIQLGAIKLGAVGSQNVDLKNIGNEDLTVSSITIMPVYQSQKFGLNINGATGAIGPDATKSAILTYTPTVASNDTAKILVVSNDPQTPNREILVYGHGSLPTMKILGPDTVKFGDVRIGSSATNSDVQIQNTGEADLAVTGVVASPSQFTVQSAPAGVGGFATIPVQLKFTPTTAGDITGMVVISGDDAKLPRDTVYLTGRGTVSQFDTPSEINFGDLKLLATRDTTVYLRNLGTASLTIGAYSITGPAGVFIALDTTKHTIGAKDSIAVKIRFTAKAAQSYSGALAIRTTEAGSSIRTINLIGRGIDSKLQLSEESIEFGEVDTMKSLTKDLVITNTGTASIAINTLGLSGAQASSFSIAHATLPRTLQPNDTAIVHITFAPIVGGSHNGVLEITPGEGSALNVLLHGTGKIDTSGSGSVRNLYYLDVPFKLSPNPTKGALTATFELTTSDDVSFSVISIDGKLARRIERQDFGPGKHELRLNVDGLANGEYILRMTNRRGQFIEERFILIR